MTPDYVGQVVHVGGPGRACLPGIVLALGRVSRIRVLRPSIFGRPGADDEEGDVRHWQDAMFAPNPNGGAPRLLDSWHWAFPENLCPRDDLYPTEPGEQRQVAVRFDREGVELPDLPIPPEGPIPAAINRLYDAQAQRIADGALHELGRPAERIPWIDRDDREPGDPQT